MEFERKSPSAPPCVKVGDVFLDTVGCPCMRVPDDSFGGRFVDLEDGTVRSHTFDKEVPIEVKLVEL